MAFVSSRVEESESKLCWGEVEFGGLTDVETGGVSGLEDELVCSFKWVADVVWGGVCSLCMTLTDQHSWKGIWWDRVWIQLAGLCSILWWGTGVHSYDLKGSDWFLQCKRHYTLYIAVGRLSSWTCNQHGWWWGK